MAVMRQRRCHQRLKSVTDCDCSAYNYFKTIESKVGTRILAELGIDIPGDIRTIKVGLTPNINSDNNSFLKEMISLVMQATRTHSHRILRKIKTKLQKKLVKFVAKVSSNFSII